MDAIMQRRSSADAHTRASDQLALRAIRVEQAQGSKEGVRQVRQVIAAPCFWCSFQLPADCRVTKFCDLAFLSNLVIPGAEVPLRDGAFTR